MHNPPLGITLLLNFIALEKMSMSLLKMSMGYIKKRACPKIASMKSMVILNVRMWSNSG